MKPAKLIAEGILTIICIAMIYGFLVVKPAKEEQMAAQVSQQMLGGANPGDIYAMTDSFYENDAMGIEAKAEADKIMQSGDVSDFQSQLEAQGLIH